MKVDDYFQLQQEYEKKYGKVVILYMFGMFFEIWCVDNDEEKIGNVPVIAELLNIQATRRNKSNPANDRSNPMMCGFPVASLKRCAAVLVAAQYTCVVVEQVTPPPNPRREVTQILSPGTIVEEGASDTYRSNHMMCLVIRGEAGNMLRLGCATLDVSTGECTVYEVIDHANDKSFALNEGVRIIKSFEPREIILYGENSPDIQSKLELGDRLIHCKEVCRGSERITYMNQFLEDFYPDKGCLSPIEHVDLENKFLACVAFVNLLKFVYDHDETSLQNLKRPTVLNELNTLCLENNAIQQLNVVNNNRSTGKATPNKIQSLLDVVGFCKTPMGARRLRDRLCRPLTNPAEISKRLDKVELLLREDLYRDMQKYLAAIGDLERLTRKLTTNKSMSHLDISKVWTGLESIESLSYLSSEIYKTLTDDRNQTCVAQVIRLLQETFQKDCLQNSLTDESVFQQGVDAELDDLFTQVRTTKDILEKYRKTFNDIVDSSSDTTVKLEYSDKEGWYLIATKKRGEALKKNLKKSVCIANENVVSDTLTMTNTTTSVKICTPQFRDKSTELIELTDNAKKRAAEKFTEVCKTLTGEFGAQLGEVVETVVELDLLACAAHAASVRGYCKPHICSEDVGSFVIAEDLRHAIIESLQTGVQYVPSSIALGTKETSMENMQDMSGMLLYGCNSAGKSSLMKAIGLSVILAQAGFYVPAAIFKLRPFENVMTRILGNDDLFKGQSSFATEMAELCGILKRANKRTLVLGDEIANSTESTSGLAIVAAAVDRLSSRDAKFVFATHLHQLSKMKEITDLENVRHFHLRIKYDAAADTLVYERKLKPGSGSAVYGLEIAKAMGLDEEFLNKAHEIRRDILQTDRSIVSTRQSRYNARLHMQPCQVCGSDGEHVHHIKEQQDADDKGRIGAIHKNDLSNLVVLCRACHDGVHRYKTLDIKGYVDTTVGRKLDFESVTNAFQKFACARQRVKAT